MTKCNVWRRLSFQDKPRWHRAGSEVGKRSSSTRSSVIVIKQPHMSLGGATPLILRDEPLLFYNLKRLAVV